MINLSSYNQYYYPDKMPLALIPQKTLSIGLSAWWAMDETLTGGADTIFDSHGSIDLVENSATEITNYSDGVLGQVLDFSSGIGSNIFIAANSAREMTYNSDFAIAGWVNFDTLSATSCVACRADNGANANAEIDWQLVWNGGSGLMNFTSITGSTGYTAEWPNALSTGTWYFLVGSYSARNAQVGISVNGGTLVTAATSGTMNTGGDQFKFGRRSFDASWDAYMDGKLSRWGHWNRLLSADEITWLAAKPRNYSDLVFT